ncbi:hypothetical protein [Aureimonas sp. AU20]|uniref:hypothetical protein n=1 Tax=Aureimonas sp. AU20 TaxID=1349819 RepID=UPI0007207BB0|nr:hypothetical protein [Aureimonas sp. AU20]ALN73990.1 hypothetical protein M673_14780 [Aureimonas sp. AU20]
MLDHPAPTALDRFEAQLRLSAEIFAARALGPGSSDESAAIGFARRFGFLTGGETSLAALGPIDRRGLVSRLEEENNRLVRAARRRSVGYDLGRHIALRRALNALVPHGDQEAPPAPTLQNPLSGRELNGRFRKRVARPAEVEERLSPPSRRLGAAC